MKHKYKVGEDVYKQGLWGSKILKIIVLNPDGSYEAECRNGNFYHVEAYEITGRVERGGDKQVKINLTLDEFCVALETARYYLREHAKVTNHRTFSGFKKAHASVFAYVKYAYSILEKSEDYEKFVEQIKFFMPKAEVKSNAKV